MMFCCLCVCVFFFFCTLALMSLKSRARYVCMCVVPWNENEGLHPVPVSVLWICLETGAPLRAARSKIRETFQERFVVFLRVPVEDQR